MFLMYVDLKKMDLNYFGGQGTIFIPTWQGSFKGLARLVLLHSWGWSGPLPQGTRSGLLGHASLCGSPHQGLGKRRGLYMAAQPPYAVTSQLTWRMKYFSVVSL